jgi:hypothetical protein
MFNRLHLFDLDAPDGSEDFRWRARSYLRMAGTVPKGPATLQWSKRQREDLEDLWRNPNADGARDRLAGDIAQFAEKLGWTPDPVVLEDAEKHGEEYLLTISSAAAELYLLPWEVMQVGASGTYLADYSGTLVRYAVPGLEARRLLDIPPNPGVLFAWSTAGGSVPHEEQGAAIRAAAEAGGVSFREFAQVDEASLRAALDDNPPSVLHLLCHGLPDPPGEPPRLSWGTPDRPGQVTAPQLARLLRGYRDAVRLVVLSACSSGDSALDTLFMSSLAQEIHKKGIPNVVASRYTLSVRGSKVLVRTLYDKMLREAWSLERALSHTRAQLFLTDDEGRSHFGDAYGIQLYACDSERFVSANGVEAERPVLANYPFGSADQPVPASKPPRKQVTLEVAGNPKDKHDRKRLRVLLVPLSEDPSLRCDWKRGARGGKLVVDTTVDGAQRLLVTWRSGDLSKALGLAVPDVTAAAGLRPPLPNGATDTTQGNGRAWMRKTLGAALAVAISSGVVLAVVHAPGPLPGPDAAAASADAGPSSLPDAAKAGIDAGTPDAGTPDAGTPDAGTPDAGTPPLGPLTLVQLDVQSLHRSDTATISWQRSPGVAGVLVVASYDGSVRGAPRDGRAYAGSWRHGGTVQILSASKTSHEWGIPRGQSLWLKLWAFDERRRYSTGVSRSVRGPNLVQ